MHAHVHQQPPFIRGMVPDVPEKLATILDRMLAKDPDDRFSTPAEVAEAIAPWCEGADLPALVKRAGDCPDFRSTKMGLSPSAVDEGRGEDVNCQAQPDLHRPLWRSRLALLILLLMVGGLGFALGIMIRIHKDGQETTIDVPVGSNAQVTADGQVDVTLPGQPKAIGKMAVPKEPPLQFGPAVERVVNAISDGKGGQGLDLASGKLVDVPKEFGKWSAEEQQKWTTQNNVDLLVDFTDNDVTFLGVNGEPITGKGGELLPEQLILGAMGGRWDRDTKTWLLAWDRATLEELRSALASPTPGRPMVAGLDNVSPSATVRESGGRMYFELMHLLATFAFQTRKGDLGILQVLRFTEEPRGIRLRYKLVPAETSRNEAGISVESPPKQQIKAFTIVYGDAASLIVTLARVLPDNTSVRLSSDSRTNTIIAAGDPESLSIVEAILMRLDKAESVSKPNASEKPSVTPAKPHAFRTAPITRGDITATISATGTIEPEEVVDVGAQVAGQIDSLGTDAQGKPIDFGSQVDMNAVLARIDDKLYRLRVEHSEAGVRRAEAELARAKARTGGGS